MKNKFLRFVPQIIIGITLYITILCVQWTYESKYTLNNLLQDIVSYDTQILTESNMDKSNIRNYADIFIEVENINLDTWLSHWNVFDWSERKYIYEKNREIILSRLNYWRETGKLPTMYNLDIKSVYNMGEEECQTSQN